MQERRRESLLIINASDEFFQTQVDSISISDGVMLTPFSSLNEIGGNLMRLTI